MDTLKEEFEYYKKNQEKLAQEYEGKFIVIKDQKVVGVYDSEFEAYENAQKDHKLGTFIIQLVQRGEENYSQTFYSRVSV